jgi:hypothetical protein
MSYRSEAHEKALEARQKMLDVRPKDTIPPLPEGIDRSHANCSQYFQVAAVLYGLSAQAYASGDEATGHLYELWAFQHIMIGQACEETS